MLYHRGPPLGGFPVKTEPSQEALKGHFKSKARSAEVMQTEIQIFYQ